ncbi:hypothetical protein WICPIJ_004201 [Wickerhamomyces pijperi]|uniref:Uncharacterized protein n=1 Tax=Wickerhamomyces pijperi TaxID=599730 RepID=A0A9P8Q638_WICPI|nr:hypothetical protein WICPIJ_004201 [Wickerhamomyces pijperi]
MENSHNSAMDIQHCGGSQGGEIDFNGPEITHCNNSIIVSINFIEDNDIGRVGLTNHKKVDGINTNNSLDLGGRFTTQNKFLFVNMKRKFQMKSGDEILEVKACRRRRRRRRQSITVAGSSMTSVRRT